ncbi:hypothetical protein FHY13_003542 [Xanthomonas arboricola]|nr:hypothetical protein [Xanthomonas euroxanthea]
MSKPSRDVAQLLLEANFLAMLASVLRSGMLYSRE